MLCTNAPACAQGNARTFLTMGEAAEAVFSNRVALGISATPGQTSCSVVGQHIMDSTVLILFLFVCVCACTCKCFDLVTGR